jgi:hypothetical protein
MKNLLIAIITIASLTQCGLGEKAETKSAHSTDSIQPDTTNEEALVDKDITLFKITQENYADAILELNTPTENQHFSANKAINFNFNAVNFPLTNGKHIALWIPSKGIQRIMSADHTTKLKPGSFTTLSFLCDEDGLSIKQPEAYALRSFTVDKHTEVNYSDSALVIINSTNQNTSFTPLLDFYLANTNISKEGNKLKLSIDSSEFQIHNWSAYKINGLAKGKHKIKIQLVNHQGEIFKSPFTADSTEIVVK